MKFEFNFLTVISGGMALFFGAIVILAINQPDPQLVDSCGDFEAERPASRGSRVSGVIASDIVNHYRRASNEESSKRHAAMERAFFEEQLIVAIRKLNKMQEAEKVWQEKTPLNTAIRGLSAINQDPYYQARLTKRFNDEVREYKETSETYQRLEAQFTREKQRYHDRWIREKTEYESQIKRHQAGIPKTSTTIVSLETILRLIDGGNLTAAKDYISACSRG